MSSPGAPARKAGIGQRLRRLRDESRTDRDEWRAGHPRTERVRLVLRGLIFGDWHPLLRDPLDLMRVAFLVAAIGFLLAGHPANALDLFLSFLVLMVAQRLNMPRLFDLLFIFGWGAQAWGNAADLFNLNVCTNIRIGNVNFVCLGYDDFVHFVLPVTSVVPLYMLGLRLGILPDISKEIGSRRRFGIVVFAALGVMAIAMLNEIWEYVSVHWLGSNLRIGYSDTIFDLALGVIGAVAGASLIWVWTMRRWPTERKPGLKRLRSQVNRV